MLLVPPPGSEMRDGIVSRRTWERTVKFDADDYNNNHDGLIMITTHHAGTHAPPMRRSTEALLWGPRRLVVVPGLVD